MVRIRSLGVYLLSAGSKGRRGPFDFALMFDESQLFNEFESELRRYGDRKPSFPAFQRRTYRRTTFLFARVDKWRFHGVEQKNSRKGRTGPFATKEIRISAVWVVRYGTLRTCAVCVVGV